MHVRENKFAVQIHKQAQKNLAKIPRAWQERIVLALEILESDPFMGEKLYGDLQGSYRLRIWPYRIVYSVYINKKIVYVTHINHRQGVYK